MAAIGSYTVALLARVGDNEPIELGTLDIPIEASPSVKGEAFAPIRVNSRAMAASLADALEQAAVTIRQDHALPRQSASDLLSAAHNVGVAL